MRKSLTVVGVLAGVLATTGAALASNGWARSIRRVGDTVPGCMTMAYSGLSRVSGGEPIQVQWHDDTTGNLHVYSGNEVIFIQCSAAPAVICGAPEANMTLHVLSEVDSPSALAKLHVADAEIQQSYQPPVCR